MDSRLARFGRSVLGVCLFLASHALTARAQTVLTVPESFATIQSAINSAANGDTVLVDAGTYGERINFLGKAITVESRSGPQVTIIDGGLSGTVVTIAANPGERPVLRGFTIRNGNGFPNAGGIDVFGGPALIENNIVTGNISQGAFPAGISARFSEATIRRNTVAHNKPKWSGGPGGGGISVLGFGSAQVLENLIDDNIAERDGAGIQLFAAGAPTIAGNVITNNIAGLYVSTAGGGGINASNSSNAFIANNVIARNRAYMGGGISWLVPSGQPGPLVINNTIAYNDATLGTAVYADGFDGSTQLTNNLLIGTGTRWVLECGTFNDINPPIIQFNDVFNADMSAGYGGACADQTGINGNIAVDPSFVNASANDFHLRSDSPAIDRGNNIGVPELDFDGEQRIFDGDRDNVALVDIGADEYVNDVTPPKITVPSDLVWTDATAPYGAIITYTVSVSDDVDRAPDLQCDPESGSVFPQLFTTVRCVASDASGNTSEATFDVLVKNADWQMFDTINLIQSWNLSKLGASLTDKLNKARQFNAQGKMSQACETLAGFLQQVLAQAGKGLTAAQAADLMTIGLRISNVIGC